MPATSLRLLSHLTLPKAGRFIVVGIAGTLTYCVVTLVLSSPWMAWPMAVASVAGFVVSLVVSYAGHAKFTFAVRDDRHGRFGPRFLCASVGLAVLCSGLAQALVSGLGLNPAVVTGLIAVMYPGASFLMHSIWSFAEPAGEP